MISFDHASHRASREWLTAALTANGYLRSGEVVAVEQRVSPIATITSTFYELDVTLSPGADGEIPSKLLMKVGKPDLFSVTSAEAAFYERARRRPPEGVLTGFATAVDEGARSAVIVLANMAEWTAPSEWPLPPTVDVCERAIRSLANVHARWWNSPELSDPLFQKMSYRRMTEAQRNQLLASFFDALGDRLSGPRRATLEMLASDYPGVVLRRRERTQIQTLIHGDAHFWNFLYPSDPALRPVLIDWQSFQCQFAARDLAYMIATHWFPERRARYESMLLHAYRDELEKRGITYGLDDLWLDYRLQVAGLMFFPIVQWSSNKIPAVIWWPHLERTFAAFEDLNCRALL